MTAAPTWWPRALAMPIIAVLVFATAAPARQSSAGSWPAAVAANGRYLVDAAGRPFFWLGDTAWRLFLTRTRGDAAFYLDARGSQGFTVTIASLVSALSEEGGITATNAYGDRAFVGGDLTRPATTPGNDPADAAQYDYWDHVDYIVSTAASRRISIGLLPFYAGYSSTVGAALPLVTATSAYTYGLFLGQRYGRAPNVFWVLGGDNRPDTSGKIGIWSALAKGITVATAGLEDYSRTLITYHPQGNHSSSEWLANVPWLDFHMAQVWGDEAAIYPLLMTDYRRVPVKPIGLGEGSYEDGPQYPTKPIDALKIRQQAYWSYFAGGYHTYGNTNVWQFGTYSAETTADWKRALNSAGASSLTVLARTFTALPWWELAPDPSMVDSRAGSGPPDRVAIRTPSGGLVLVYASAPGRFTVNLSALPPLARGTRVFRGTWIDPQTGERYAVGDISERTTPLFTTPTGWQDALLMLDTPRAVPRR